MQIHPFTRMAGWLAVMALTAAGCGSAPPVGEPAIPIEIPSPPAATESGGTGATAQAEQSSASAPTALPAVMGDTVFEDDFSNTAGAWLQPAPGEQAGEVVGGEYRLVVDNDAAPGLLVTRPAGQEFGDATIRVDLRLESAPGLGSAGVVCRYVDEDNYYAFLIDGLNVEIVKMELGRQEILVYDLPSPAVRPSANHLKVTCTGSLLEISVNDQAVAFISDYSLHSGDAGLAAGGNDSGYTEVFFDNFHASGFSPANSTAAQIAPTPPLPPTPQPGAGGRSIVDPCTLLTKEDAEEILGRPVGEAEVSQSGPFQECLYNAGDGSFNMLGIQVQTGVSEAMFDAQAKNGAEFMEVELFPVDGVGDKAYWLIGILQVLKGDVFYQYIAFISADDDENLRLSIELGRRAAARLP